MDAITRDLLPIYWSRLFPFQEMYKWLNYAEENLFEKREFAFNFGNGDRFLRNLSFKNVQALKTFIKKTMPNKIDIGAVYSVPPKSGQTNQFAVQKELVIDIDLSDYDDVRVCCSKANICQKCWKYMTLAVQILDAALREDFGFKHVLWVYSGRRGIHAWICDKKVRSYSSEARLAICNYLQLVKGGDYVSKKVQLRANLHTCERRALEMIDKVFVELCVVGQDMLGTEKSLDKFLSLIHEPLRRPLKECLMKYPSSLSRWNAFVRLYKRNKKRKCIPEWIERTRLIEEIKIQYAYPRIDLQVTHSFTHLLKSPFSIHPKTGKIGVPIILGQIETFDPQSLPTICELMEQIDSFTTVTEKLSLIFLKSYTHDLQKTSLKDHYSLFRKFVDRLILDTD